MRGEERWEFTVDVGKEFGADGFGDLGVAAVDCDWGRGCHARCLGRKRLRRARVGSVRVVVWLSWT